MLQAFAFGTLLFWLTAIVGTILIIWSLEADENQWNSTLWFAIAVTLVALFGNSEFFTTHLKWVIDNPGKTLGFALIWVIAGMLVSMLKWFLWLKAVYRSRKRNMSSYDTIKASDYTASNNKERIIHWAIWWPFTISWIAINHPVRKIFTHLVEYFSGAYDRISEKIMKPLEQEYQVFIDKLKQEQEEKYKN